MNEKRTHIKKLLSYYKIFLIPFKKKLESEKKQILLQLIRQTIQFIQQKPFFFYKSTGKKTFLLKKISQKKQRGKKTVIVIHQIIEKKKSSNE